VRNLLNRRVFTAGLTVIVLGAVGLVYAAWTTNGTGEAYVKAGTAQDLTTVDVSASTTASLYPGVSGNVLIKINNPNPFPVRVTAVTGSGTVTPDSGHAAGCTTTGVSFTNQSGLTLDIAGSTATQFTLNAAAAMSNSSSNGCQGAIFTIPVSLTGTSNAP
jgi:hypothetical protein